jgi:hypothetical protein
LLLLQHAFLSLSQVRSQFYCVPSVSNHFVFSLSLSLLLCAVLQRNEMCSTGNLHR